MSTAEDTDSAFFRARAPGEATVLALHHGYRVAGGEERAAADLSWLAETELGERVALLERDSGTIGALRAASGLLRGGLDPGEVASAVRAAVDVAGSASGVTAYFRAGGAGQRSRARSMSLAQVFRMERDMVRQCFCGMAA